MRSKRCAVQNQGITLTWVVVLLVDSIYICDGRCSLCVYTIQLRTQTLQKKQR